MLTIVRGLPGSGKSTLAFALADMWERGAAKLVEADQYFMQNGQYVFDPKLLPAAHADCQKRARKHLEDGKQVYVSNTFTQRWEYQPYLDMAAELGVKVQVIDVHGDFGSVHNVPDETMTRMRNRWEPHNG
jgi:predicted kinase